MGFYCSFSKLWITKTADRATGTHEKENEMSGKYSDMAIAPRGFTECLVTARGKLKYQQLFEIDEEISN